MTFHHQLVDQLDKFFFELTSNNISHFSFKPTNKLEN